MSDTPSPLKELEQIVDQVLDLAAPGPDRRISEPEPRRLLEALGYLQLCRVAGVPGMQPDSLDPLGQVALLWLSQLERSEPAPEALTEYYRRTAANLRRLQSRPPATGL